MPGRSSGFAIGFGIQDNASAGIDAINKRIAALTAPAERFNRSIQKFGEVSGINRAAEGIQTLGDRALGAARAVERLAGPMAGLTSAASLGGMVELSRRWAEAGNQVARTSAALNTPVPRLTALRGAARLAGVSADAMDASLKGLGDTLATAKYKGGPIVPLLNQLHIGFQGVGEEARTGADALGEVADAVARYKDPHAQLHILQQLGISEDLLPLLQKGRKGLEEYLATAQQTGGAMTAEMAANATKMNRSWAELGLAIEGVGNRMVDSWSGTATKILDTTSRWIERNQAQADSFTKIGIEFGTLVAVLAARKPAMWILRLLMLEPLAIAAGAALANQLPPITEKDRGSTLLTPGGMSDSTKRLLGLPTPMLSSDDYEPSSWPRWLGGSPGTGGPVAGNVLDGPTATRAKLVHDGLMARGMDSNTAWGFAANAVQESRADPHSQPGDNGAAHGLFMWRDSDDGGRRYTNYVNRYGHAPEQGTLDEQLDYTMHELNGPEGRAWTNIARAGNTPGEKAAVISTYYERPKDTAAEESRRREIASRLAAMAPNGIPAAGPVFGPQSGNGTVRVDVHLHGAPAGTTAAATGTGAVMVTPPNIQTSMPLAH